MDCAVGCSGHESCHVGNLLTGAIAAEALISLLVVNHCVAFQLPNK